VSFDIGLGGCGKVQDRDIGSACGTKVIWIRGWMISKNMTSRIFQAQTGVRLLYPRGSLVGKAPSMQRCKEARSHQQRARTDRTTLDLTSTSTSSSTSTLTLTLYRTVSISVPKLRSKTKAILNPRPERLSPEQTLQGQASAPIEEQTAGQLLHAPSELAVERHLPQSPTSA
jgi:hypothetical protein